jgi:hypothetical protein
MLEFEVMIRAIKALRRSARKREPDRALTMATEAGPGIQR